MDGWLSISYQRCECSTYVCCWLGVGGLLSIVMEGLLVIVVEGLVLIVKEGLLIIFMVPINYHGRFAKILMLLILMEGLLLIVMLIMCGRFCLSTSHG